MTINEIRNQIRSDRFPNGVRMHPETWKKLDEDRESLPAGVGSRPTTDKDREFFSRFAVNLCGVGIMLDPHMPVDEIGPWKPLIMARKQ